MTFSPSQTLKLEGQQFLFNPETNVVILDITQPFLKAAESVGWDKNQYGSVGFGINQKITSFIISRKTKLMVRAVSWNTAHWLNHDKIKQFIKNNPCRYTVSGNEIFVFPKSLFSEKPHQEEKP